MRTEAYVIALERAAHRRERIERMIADCPVPCRAVAAVDGAALSTAEVDAHYRRYLHRPRYYAKLNRGEIGCFSSHRKVWAQMAVDRLDAALILEDDVSLKTPEFHAAFAFALRHIRPGDYLKFQLRKVGSGSEVRFTDGTHSILAPKTPPLSTVAQLVTAEAAARLLEATAVFDRPVDAFLQMTWLTRTPLTVINPSGIFDASPQLGGSTLASRKSFVRRLQHEVRRPLYRAQIAMLARLYSKAS